MECLYIWKTRPELVRFIAVATLTYLVQVSSQWLANDFADWTDWRKALVAFLVGLVQFVGARVLTWLGEQAAAAKPPGQRDIVITADGPVRQDDPDSRES